MAQLSAPSFKKITANLYAKGVNKQKLRSYLDNEKCKCPKSKTKCSDESCELRALCIECQGSCSCQNRRFGNQEWLPGIERFLTEDKGFGLRTKNHIEEGTFIMEYVGDIIDMDSYKDRVREVYVNTSHSYALSINGGFVIDAQTKGGEARFLNHSCDPNCEIQKWSVDGYYKMGLFSKQEINVGDELSCDYNFSYFDPSTNQKCLCGSPNCKGTLEKKKSEAAVRVYDMEMEAKFVQDENENDNVDHEEDEGGDGYDSSTEREPVVQRNKGGRPKSNKLLFCPTCNIGCYRFPNNRPNFCKHVRNCQPLGPVALYFTYD